jgi:4-amino-4-deoxy-L-arabinose transferase-like glycosyltransferase
VLIPLLLTFALCLALSWLPGYGLARLLRTDDGDDAAVLAWPLSWAILGGMQLLGFVVGLPSWWRFALAAICAGLSLYALAALRRRPLGAQMARVLLLAVGGVAATVCLATVIPVYDGLAGWYGDWWMHYDISQFYLGLRPDDVMYFGVYSIPSRFPMFNLLQAALLTLLGNHFWVYQITGVAPLGGLVCATYALARQWVGKQAALLACLLVVCNPFVIQNALTYWNKAVAATCILLGLYFYLRRGASGLRWWAALTGLGLMVHQSAIFVAVAVALHALARYKRQAIAPLVQAAALAALICAPWLLWALSRFGLSAMLAATPTISARGAALGSIGWIGERLWNALGTLAPLSFLRAAAEWVRAGFAGEQLPALFGAILRYEYDVLPGAVTTVLSLLLLARLWAWRGQAAGVKRDAAVGNGTLLAVLVCVCAFAGAIAVHPGLNRSGLAAESLEPVVVLLLIMAARSLLDLPQRRRTIIAALLLVEFAITRGLHTLLIIVGLVPVSNDPNLALKLDKGITFIADMVTWEEAVAVLALGVIWLALGRWLLRYVRAPDSAPDAL